MSKQSVKSHFLIHEVVALTGFTKYMLDYLSREEIFAPSGITQRQRGLKRRYTYEDVVILRALRKICSEKGKISHLKEALLEFRKKFGPLKPGQKLDKRLYIQGNELCIYSSAEGGRQIRSGQMTFSFVIDLSVVSNEIAKCVVVDRDDMKFKLTDEVAVKAEEERQRIWAPIKKRRENDVA